MTAKACSTLDGRVPWPLVCHADRRKKVGDFFTNAKVPVQLLARVAVVVDGEGIVWLGGYRPDERARLRPDTRQILTRTLRQA